LAPAQTASQNLNPNLFSSGVVDPLFNPETRLEDSMMS